MPATPKNSSNVRLFIGFLLLASILVPPAAAGESCDTAPTGGIVRVRMDPWPAPRLEDNADRLERMLVRSYELYVPDELPDSGVPLVVSIHGNSGSGANHGRRSGWVEHAGQHKIIAAFPNGQGPGVPRVGTSWRAAEGSADVAYIRDIVADVMARRCIDSDRVFASGHSNGANLAQRLACDAEDLFASVAWYAGGEPNGSCSLDRGIGVASFHGTEDTTIAIEDAEVSRDNWIARLECEALTSTTLPDGTQDRHSGCRDGVEVRWRRYDGRDHTWPTDARRDDLIARMWDHFTAHPRP